MSSMVGSLSGRALKRLLILSISLLVLVGLAVVVVHDIAVLMRVMSPATAYFKATYSVLKHVDGYGSVDLYRGGDARYREQVERLGIDEFKVDLWIRMMNGKEEPDLIQVSCVMRCDGVDDWTLVRIRTPGSEWRDLHERLSPTRFVNPVWW
jgi:hypothetical protein